MKPIVVSDILAVGEVPTPDQMDILAKAGFRSVVNNQPDGEVDRFPGSAALAADAKKHGLGYAFAPLTSRTPSASELQDYATALRALPAPIFAFCYSGARSAAGCALLLTETMEPDAIVRQFADAGFEVDSLRPWLDDERARRAVPAKADDHGEHLPPAANGPSAVVSVAKDQPAPTAAAAPLPIAAAVQGIVVHARAAGYGGFAM